MKINPLFLALGLVPLVGCGGSGGDNTPEPTTPTPAPEVVTPTPAPEATTIEVTAIDGYLKNATVCLDINNDGDCQVDSEPTSSVSATGLYSLDTTNMEGSPADYNIIVKVIAGTTIDLDSPNKTIEKGYILTAPKGETIVTPLTTLVQAEVINGNDISTAKTIIKGKLGLSEEIDLMADYIAMETPALHQIAQNLVAAELMPTEVADIVTGNTDNQTSIDTILADIKEVLPLLDSDTPLTLQSCLDSLPDSGYVKKVGDTVKFNSIVIANQGEEASPTTTMELQYLGNTGSFSIANHLTNLPNWINENKGKLFVSKFVGYTAEGEFSWSEEDYSGSKYFYAFDAYNADQNPAWGAIRTTQKDTISVSASMQVLNKVMNSGTVTNVAIKDIRAATAGTDFETLPIKTLKMDTVFLGKEEITVPAGTFMTCKTRETEQDIDNESSYGTQTIWSTNTGRMKEERTSDWRHLDIREATEIGSYFPVPEGIFTDVKFELCVQHAINTNPAKITSLNELEHFSCYNRSITDTTGLATLTGLTYISFVNGNKLKSLSEIDVSANTELESLWLSGNNYLTELDITNNTKLVNLTAAYTSISALDLSQLPNLQRLEVEHTKISALDVSSNPALTNLTIDSGVTIIGLDNTRTEVEYVTPFDAHPW